VELRYETAGTLVLREVLRPAQVPAHAALVRQHGDSVAKHLAGLACKACKADPDAAPKGGRGGAAAGEENQPPEGAGPGAQRQHRPSCSAPSALPAPAATDSHPCRPPQPRARSRRAPARRRRRRPR
jgi:hypothetical protein